MLPDLCYLECHRVDEARREAAAGRHQGDMFRIKMDEEQEAEERKRREKEEEDRRRRKEAFVDTLQVITTSIWLASCLNYCLRCGKGTTASWKIVNTQLWCNNMKIK